MKRLIAMTLISALAGLSGWVEAAGCATEKEAVTTLQHKITQPATRYDTEAGRAFVESDLQNAYERHDKCARGEGKDDKRTQDNGKFKFCYQQLKNLGLQGREGLSERMRTMCGADTSD